MQSVRTSTDPAAPASAARPWAAWSQYIARLAPRWPGRRTDGPVSALMVGAASVLAVRVEPALQPGGRLRLLAAMELPVEALQRLRDERICAGSRTVLVLPQEQRQLLALERPEVPDAELPLAVRFPLAEALEQEPDQVLATALVLPRISEAGRDQVLAIGAPLPAVQQQLAALKAVGIKARSIDIIDSALRGMALLHAQREAAAGDDDRDGRVVLAFVGHTICIGLLWRGAFCALRSLPLPTREPRDAAEFEEHLALHIQRTTDQFERQATQLAVRRVLAAMPSLAPDVRESVRDSLPLTPELFDAASVFDGPDAALAAVAGHNDLSALACVAAARLVDAAREAAPATEQARAEVLQ